MANSLYDRGHCPHVVRRAGQQFSGPDPTTDPFSRRGFPRAGSAGSQRMIRIAAVLLAALPLGAQAPLQLSLRRAVEIAASPEGNTSLQLSGETVKQAQARSMQARASLLPDLSG